MQRTKPQKLGQHGQNLEHRLAAYGGEVIITINEFAEKKGSRHVSDQLLRSGSGAGAHYAEARSSQSRRDFIHKVSLAAKEVRESLHWIRVAAHAGLRPHDELRPSIREAEELVAILFACMNTARKNSS